MLLAAAMLVFAGCIGKPKSQVAVNPLTYTDIPDNDVIRVGDTFYMVSTTMYFCPGAPIMKSKDLVHWETTGYIFDCLEDDDIYNLRNGQNAYGKGQWATSIRYVDGIFYALFIANDQRKTYVYKTDDIENGPWSRTVIDRPMHDASMLFEDGRLYVVWGNGDLRITELEPDASAIKEGGVDQLLFSAPKEGYGLRAEGAHFYHIGDYYYVLVIDWPQEAGVRTETCWRSKDLLGPYESKVVLQGRFDGRNDGVAQGAIIDTPKGDWYAIMFQDHGAVGRIPTIQPVTWIDGWPVMGDNGVPMKEVTVNLPASGKDYVWDNDEFESDKLALVWEWNHKPLDGKWSLTENPGFMRIHATLANDIFDARNTLTQRTAGPRCKSEVLLDASGLKPGGRAGISAFQSNNCTIGVEVAEDGTKSVVVRDIHRNRTFSTDAGGDRVFGVSVADSVVYSAPLEGDKVWLRLDYVFTPQEDDTVGPDIVSPSWSADGKTWTGTGYSLRMRYTLDLFTGYRTALFCYALGDESGYADFDCFHQYVY